MLGRTGGLKDAEALEDGEVSVFVVEAQVDVRDVDELVVDLPQGRNFVCFLTMSHDSSAIRPPEDAARVSDVTVEAYRLVRLLGLEL